MLLTLYHTLTSAEQSHVTFGDRKIAGNDRRALCSLQKVTYAAFVGKVVENNGRSLLLLEKGRIITLIIQAVVSLEMWRRVINCLRKCEFP